MLKVCGTLLTSNFIKMARKFGKYGWNRQFKNKPVRRDRWDPFPKDHLPFIDDFSVGAYGVKKAQVDAMRSKRDRLATPTTLLGKRIDIDTARKGPGPKRARTGSATARNLFTNESVSLLGTAGLGAAGMARAGAGIAWDRLNARIGSALEEGFARHAAVQNSGVYTYDALTESAMAGRYLNRAIATGERILPLVEDLLVPFLL